MWVVSGGAAQAQKVVDKLSKENPLEMLLQEYSLPIIRAEIELNRGNAAKAIRLSTANQAFRTRRCNGMPPTFEARGQGMRKMKSDSLAALVTMAARLRLAGALGPNPPRPLDHGSLGNKRHL